MTSIAMDAVWPIRTTVYDAAMPLGHRRRWLLWAGLAGALVVIAAVVVVVIASRRAGDVSNPDVEFDRRSTQPTVTEQSKSADHPGDDGFAWPIFGLTKQRTHVLPLRTPLRPPFRQAWAVRGSTLIEFPPVLCRRSVYLLKNNGALYKVSRWTGAVDWKRKLGTLAASSPACGHGTVYSVLLQGKRGRGGRIVALSAKTGAVRWSRVLPSRAESSPLLDRGRLYFGSEDGTVYALRASDGAIRWTYKASGAVKGALALDRGRLFFGDYSGAVHAIRRSDGGKVWKVRAAGSRAFGLGGGRFYSSPAVSYGRVYIGSTNGAVYSFAARNGKLAWRKQTGAYVYASPAVGEAPGGRPTVWIGSYNGTFYALDAQKGRVRWSRNLGGKISGTAAVVGDLVFVSSIGLKSSWALDAGSGVVRWKTRRGAFSPGISDGRRIYFNGYSSLFGLDAKGVRFAKTPARSAGAMKRKQAADHARARHIRYLRRKAARHNAYLKSLCRRISRTDAPRAQLRKHGCYAYWEWVARERKRLRR
jgi:outer membrane protein assembly factor BamB